MIERLYRTLRRPLFGCLSGLLLMLSQPVSGATVFGVVSERSAAEMAAGAERFLAAQPDHRIILRTPEQLANLDNSALDDLVSQADALLMAAVFGEQVGRIERAVGEQAAVREFPILGVNGDRALTVLSRLQGRKPLEGLDATTLNNLMKAPDPGTDLKAHLAELKARFPEQEPWLEGRALYQGRTPQHLDALLRWLLVQAGEELDVPVLP